MPQTGVDPKGDALPIGHFAGDIPQFFEVFIEQFFFALTLQIGPSAGARRAAYHGSFKAVDDQFLTFEFCQRQIGRPHNGRDAKCSSDDREVRITRTL